jgi:hypothetical protein
VTGQEFSLVLMLGAALLALWILWRYARFGPRRIFWALAHVIFACVVLRLLPLVFPEHDPGAVSLGLYVEVFALALPALVYAFLSGGWLTRILVGLLPRS